MAVGTIKVEMDKIDIFKDMVQILKEICLDERLDETVRSEYIDKVNVLIENR